MTHPYTLPKFKQCLFFLLLMVVGFGLKAQTIYVDTAGDSGAGTLRAAIDSANVHAGLDTIVLQLNAQDTIYLLSPLPTITDSLVVTGLACQNPGIVGGFLFGSAVFHATSATAPLTIDYLNIFSCVDTAAGAQGGAVKAHLLYVNNCYFTGDAALANTGTGKGGAIYAVSAWISNSTFDGNTAANANNTNGQGGGIYVLTSATISNCTFDSNYAATYGGAIYCDSIGSINNCTIVNGSAGISGGGLAGTDVTIIGNSIVWDNEAGASGAGVYFSNSATSGGCNVLQASGENVGINTASSDISGSDPLLDSLSYYNGCVPVIPIFCGSPAQNHATCSGATSSDEQGIPAYGTRDAGAFEITPPTLGGDTIDSIQPGTTADLLSLFNTQGLTFYFIGHYTDSTQVDTGTYTLIATNYLGCTDTAVAVVLFGTDTSADSTASVRNISKTEYSVSVFPDPAQNLVNIRFNRPENGALQLSMYDATGRSVLVRNVIATGGAGSINISGLSDGLYLLQLTDASGNRYCTKLTVMVR